MRTNELDLQINPLKTHTNPILDAYMKQVRTPQELSEVSITNPILHEWALSKENMPLTPEEAENQRLLHLQSLPCEGFDSEAQRLRTIQELAVTGLPVNDLTKIIYGKNTYKDPDTLASIVIGGANRGKLTEKELLEKHPEKRPGTFCHEQTHLNSPFRPENAGLFGSEKERLEIAAHIIEVAEQTKTTKKFLNGYHAYLYKKLNKGEISDTLYYEETWAIMCQLAMTNEEKLEQVENSQRREMARLHNLGRASSDKIASLTTKIGENGEITLSTVDIALMKLLEPAGITNYSEYCNHLSGLIGRFNEIETEYKKTIGGGKGNTKAPDQQNYYIIPTQYLAYQLPIAVVN